jgi:hypothetical protein
MQLEFIWLETSNKRLGYIRPPKTFKGISKNLDLSYRTGSGICFGVVGMGFRHKGRNDI